MDQQWEYCLLVQSGSADTSVTNLHFGGPYNHPSFNALKGCDWFLALGRLGSAGWELVSFIPTENTEFANSSGAYFKRPVQPGRPVHDVVDLFK
jgi:hypothetical protein